MKIKSSRQVTRHHIFSVRVTSIRAMTQTMKDHTTSSSSCSLLSEELSQILRVCAGWVLCHRWKSVFCGSHDTNYSFSAEDAAPKVYRCFWNKCDCLILSSWIVYIAMLFQICNLRNEQWPPWIMPNNVI